MVGCNKEEKTLIGILYIVVTSLTIKQIHQASNTPPPLLFSFKNCQDTVSC